MPDFTQQTWNESVQEDCIELIRLAVREDLAREYDWTTIALVPRESTAAARVMAREDGVIAGLEVARLVVEEMNLQASWDPHTRDGEAVTRGQSVARIAGNARDLLTAERTILNFMGRLSGIASLTRKFVEAVAGTSAQVYDTRKTAPGWRRLEKFAVQCGGGKNHRSGLYDAILIKDNHLALGREEQRYSPADAVRQAHAFVAELQARNELNHPLMIEIELDTLDEFTNTLAAGPDIILLDNMSLDELRLAVKTRNQLGSTTQLEASGGVRLATIRAIAETGVERISCGALTHSALNFDVALDWE
jgi:nicotinate-nucleotide pyrophosphorylase (carboxylating)